MIKNRESAARSRARKQVFSFRCLFPVHVMAIKLFKQFYTINKLLLDLETYQQKKSRISSRVGA